MRKKSLLSGVVASALLSISLIGCGSSDSAENTIEKFFNSGAVLPYENIGSELDNGAKEGEKFFVRNGGYGSAATVHPTNDNQFYALTDRGPNATYTGDNGKGKMFPVADYTPRIGLFELQSDGSVTKVKDILLKKPDGTQISGLPNSSALGGTGETPYDADGKTILDEEGNIKLDDYGLDGEGLVALSDGTFWISDEYGPHMVHFNADGVEIGRINPFASDTRLTHQLPTEFSYRRANRGMEGLTITPDEKTLVGIMQSTMYLPSSEVKSLNITRIVTVDVATGATMQYLYKQEKAQNSNSEIVALSNDQFLVIERDGNFYQGGSKDADENAQKHVYKITLSSGTELENIFLGDGMVQDADLGLTINGTTLEQTVLNGGWEALEAKGIYPVGKELLVDMVEEVSYPHDKMEGLVVFRNGKLGVVNDDDFATWSSSGVLEQKYINADNTTVDGNILYTIENLNLSGKLEKIGSYETNLEGGSEIVAYCKIAQRMYITNGENNSIDIIDISTPNSPVKVTSIDLSSYGRGVNSVAANGGKIAVAVENGNDTVGKKQLKGSVVIFDQNGTHERTIEAGYLPDMVTFNEDGTKIIVANEGEPNDSYSVDPIGSIGIINVASGAYTDITFAGVTLSDAADGTAVRLGGTPSNDQSKDLEPEYITVSGNYAYVSLQENNALAKVNLTTNTLEFVKSLGAKSWEENSGNTLDIEEEGLIKMKSYPALFGLYQPDSIASYTYNGETYLVTANEGDGREYIYEIDAVDEADCDTKGGDDWDDGKCLVESHVDEKKISKLTLDPAIASAYTDENDLKVMVDLGDTNNDGSYEKLYTYGARSFSIWDSNGDLVWDSGDEISKKVAQIQPKLFNQDEGEIDGRSGNKASEPEALTVGTIDGKTYAFVGLERQNAIIIYDVTNPLEAKYVDYIEIQSQGDISPEGMKFIPASDAPNGKNLLLVSYEVSGSTVVYEVKL